MVENKIIRPLIYIVVCIFMSTTIVCGQVMNTTTLNVDASASMMAYFNTTGNCSSSLPTRPFGLQVSYANSFFPTFASGTIAPIIRGDQTTINPVPSDPSQFNRTSQYYVLPYKVAADYGISISNISFQLITPDANEAYTTSINTFGKGNPGELICGGTFWGAYTGAHSADMVYSGAIYRYLPDYGKLEFLNTVTHRINTFQFVQNTDLAKIGIIKAPNTVFGSALISTTSSTVPSDPGINISVMAGSNGQATFDLVWQGESAYCNEVFHPSNGGQIKVEALYQDGTVLSSQSYSSTVVVSGNDTQYKPGQVTVSGTGVYEFIIRIKDHWGHEYRTSSVKVKVLPSCYGQPAPNVTLTGSNLVTIDGGYGNPLGSYRLQKDHEYTLNLGSIQDFRKYYQVSLGDGITVVTPSQSGPSLPIPTSTNPGTGLQVTDTTVSSIGFKFIPRDVIGSYKIDIQKRPNLSAQESMPTLGNMCPNYQSIVLTVGGQNENLTSNCLIVLAPSTVSSLFPGVSSYTGINSVLQYFDYTLQSTKGVIVKSEGGEGIFLKDGATLAITDAAPEEIPLAEQIDSIRNWVQSRSYDDEGRIISEGKQFFDNRGRVTQNQAKNLSAGVVMATQTLYDQYGREAITTLPAPIRASEVTQAVDECGDNIQQGQDLYMIYKENFVTQSGTPYRYTNYDNVGAGTKRNNPDALDNTVPGTLGWYYGPNNVAGATVDQSKNQQRFIEPYVAQTSYPYSRNLYLEDGTNEPFATTLPGDQHKAGTGRQDSTYTTALTTADKALISDYLLIRGLHVFKNINNNPANLDASAFRVSVNDIEHDESVSIQDEEGRALITHHIATGNKTFTYYDVYGRVVCSITPNGVEVLLANKTDTSLYKIIDKKTYRYNYKGLLIETKEKDFGTTKFMYRLDGKLRYSQNDKQKQTKSFDYFIYDYAGRITESGLFTPAIGSNLLFNSNDLRFTMEETASNFNLSSGGTKSEVLYTVYDSPDNTATSSGLIGQQTFLRNRISYTYKIEEGSGTMIKSWFSYDEQGRVIWTAQQIPNLTSDGGAFGIKKIEYTYAPNGSVKEVAYTGNMFNDKFYHSYYYDLDNRLSYVYASNTKPIYNSTGEITNGKLQAHYTYYLHGELKRAELADNLQGLDYTYTPQGWLKSFNHPVTGLDPGKDGSTNSNFPEDVFAQRYDYFNNDYQKPGTNIISEQYFKNSTDTYQKYYNGNIAGLSWMKKDQYGVKQSAAYAYEYDSKSQLKNADFLSVTLGSGASFNPIFSNSKNQERNITYDANGNLLTLLRTGADSNPKCNLDYNYRTNSNKLLNVENLYDGSVYGSYEYDSIGQLRYDIHYGDKKYYHYNNQGFLSMVSADSTGTNPIVKFYYDNNNQRYKKETYNSSFSLSYTNFYVHDESNEVVAVYSNNGSALALVENPIYGLDKIGVFYRAVNNGQYTYEIKDHLGNVRSVLYPVYTSLPNSNFITGFEGSDITNYGNDYSASTKSYPTGFTGGYGSKVLALQFPNKPLSPAYKHTVRPGDKITQATIQTYLPTTGINAGYLVVGFFDQNSKQLYYDQNKLNPAKDSSLQHGIAQAWSALSVGDMTVPQILYDEQGSIVNNDRYYLNVYVNQTAESANTEIFYDQLRVNISFAPIVNKNNLQGVVALTDYYPFGLTLDGAYATSLKYRFGYQGQNAEIDPETGYNAFELRMYDPLIGRWHTVDPSRQYPNPYLANGNNPVNVTDPDGGCDNPPCDGANTTASMANNLLKGFGNYYTGLKDGFSNFTWSGFGKGLGEFALGTPYKAYKDYSLAFEIGTNAWNGDYDLAAFKLGNRLGAHSFEVGTTLATAGTGSYVSNASNKIIGFAQSTGTRGHAFLSQTTAYYYALNPYVKRVTMDLGYKRLLGISAKNVRYGPRPDVGVLFKNNRIKVIEVASKTDDLIILARRNREFMRLKLGIANPNVKVLTGARLLNKIYPK